MRANEYVAVLKTEGDLLGRAAERAGLDAEVPTCPGWRVRDLVRHVGGVHRWADAHVGPGRTHPFMAEDERQFFEAPDDGSLIEWFTDGHARLVRTLVKASPDLVCWTFLPGAPSPLAFWARRQAHETAVHRADAEAALGVLPTWEPAFALDGLDELFNGFFARRPERIVADPPVVITLQADDAAGAGATWTLRMGSDGLRVIAGPGAEPPTLTLTGSATELYLLMWNRVGPDRLRMDGDLGALKAWRENAIVSW